MALLDPTTVKYGIALGGAAVAAFVPGGADPVAYLLDGPDLRQWSLVSAEAGLLILGDFRPRDGVQVMSSASISRSHGLGDQGELVSFLGGMADQVAVTVELFSERPFDSLRSRVEQLQALCAVDRRLGRAPICTFSWGSEFSRDVQIVSVGVQIRRLWPNGGMCEVAVTLDMIQATPVSVEQTILGAPLPESTEVVLQAGETFELLAARYYGDPALGVNLRHRHVQFEGGIEVAGERALVVGREHPDVRSPVAFLSPPLEDGGDLAALWQEHLEARGGSTLLPEG